MMDGNRNWVEQAAKMPVAFSQVREDALLDESVVLGLGEKVDVLMIASGGCTAALLASMPQVRRLHLVDPNPAQLALCRLKLHLLRHSRPPQRLALLGHQPMREEERRSRLGQALSELRLPRDALGAFRTVVATGPDHVGRYERVFRALQFELGGSERELLSALRSSTANARAFALDTPLGRKLDEALEQVMSLPNLVRLFGEDATNNPEKPFHAHFADRIRWIMENGQASTNPYLWQMLTGSFPENRFAPWLTRQPSAHPPDITESCGRMEQVLKRETGAYDFVHLSNILDWLSPEYAEKTLDLTAKALRPSGQVLIRQLNSTLDIRGAGTMFRWLTSASQDLWRRDRSFFYRALHLGRKR